MKTTLASILWKKEIKHWNRIIYMLKAYNNYIERFTLGIVVAIMVTIFHYMFAFMHTMYEIVLFIFSRKTFRSNLQKMT